MSTKRSLLSLILMLLMLSFSTLVYAEGTLDLDNLEEKPINSGDIEVQSILNDVVKRFKDFKADQWYSEVMAKLTALGGFSGYPDGTIRPNGTVTKGEFVKILIDTLGHKVDNKTNKGHWARPWVDKATELNIIPGYISTGEFKDSQLNEPIKRELMAILVRNSVNRYSEEEYKRLTNYENYEQNISDLWKVTYKKEVLQGYALGIMGGYPDGTYRPQDSLTRAEASSVVIRVIDPKKREIIEPKGKEVYSNNPETQYINELGKRYPNNSTIYSSYNFRYNATKKPETNADIVLLVSKIPSYTTDRHDYSIVLFDNHTEKDKEVLKEVLKNLYPTSYEKVYKKAIETIKKHYSADDVVENHDNRTIRYRRDGGSILLIVGQIGK